MFPLQQMRFSLFSRASIISRLLCSTFFFRLLRASLFLCCENKTAIKQKSNFESILLTFCARPFCIMICTTRMHGSSTQRESWVNSREPSLRVRSAVKRSENRKNAAEIANYTQLITSFVLVSMCRLSFLKGGGCLEVLTSRRFLPINIFFFLLFIK